MKWSALTLHQGSETYKKIPLGCFPTCFLPYIESQVSLKHATAFVRKRSSGNYFAAKRHVISTVVVSRVQRCKQGSWWCSGPTGYEHLPESCRVHCELRDAWPGSGLVSELFLIATDPSSGFKSKHNTLGFIEAWFLKGSGWACVSNPRDCGRVCGCPRVTVLTHTILSYVACVIINSRKG